MRRNILNQGTRDTRGAIATIAIAIVILLSGASSAVRAHGGPEGRRFLSIPLAAVGLVAGDGIRTTLTNYSRRAISVQAVVIDADGQIVRQDTLLIASGTSQSVAMGRSEVPRSEQSAMVRVEIVAREADAKHLAMTTEVVEWATARTRIVVATKDVEDKQTIVQNQTQQ